MAVSYDFVAEDGYFPKLVKADKMKKSEKSLTSSAGKLYYTFLELHFFHNMYGLGKGNIYVDIGKPILVEPNVSKKELALRAHEEAARCSRITMPALVCYAISQGRATRNEIEDAAQKLSEVLGRKEVNFDPGADLKKSIELALNGLVGRKIVSDNGTISKRRPEIVNYYANTIAHHFGPP